ncbi:MAG: hypothetical protein KBB66_00415 [Prolixibacteraceae bacterium]|nr:hypothetical protein [Prolixibacteraceae bacterium]
MKAAEFFRLYGDPERLGDATLPALKQMVGDFPWFREGWMLYLKNLKLLNHPDYDLLLLTVALRCNDRKRLKRLLEGNRNVYPQNSSLGGEYLASDLGGGETGSSVAGNQEGSGKLRLIEQFLENGATFQNLPGDASPKSGIDLAEKATEPNDEIITLTFAELLVSQSKYEEAIEAFNKLSLRIPGKSIYFAARIEEVKKKMNH